MRTEDHYRSFLGKMRNLVKDGTYTAGGSFDKSNSTRSGGEKAWEMLTDVTGLLTEGVYGGSPASFALGSYNLDYELLGVACEPPRTDPEWDHGALVGQVQGSITQTMNITSAIRMPTGGGYKNGDTIPGAKGIADGVKKIWPEGQKNIVTRINFIEESYVPY